jgi:hypothetical protein
MSDYEIAKAAYDKAKKAIHSADKRLYAASKAFREAKVKRNASLKPGFYIEPEATTDTNFPIYLKNADGDWLWNDDNGNSFTYIPWLDEEFDIDVIPISEYKIS